MTRFIATLAAILAFAAPTAQAETGPIPDKRIVVTMDQDLAGQDLAQLFDTTFEACRAACDPKFADYAIYEHCLPFNVARAYDEALGIDTPRIWTAERDKTMWEALQG